MKTELKNKYEATEIEVRTSSNNMLCVVTYEPVTDEEQEEVAEILKVAN